MLAELQVREVEESAESATRRDLAEIREELRLLRAQLSLQESGTSVPLNDAIS